MIDSNLFLHTAQKSSCHRFLTHVKKFMQGHNLADLDPDILFNLRNKAWLASSLITLIRISQMCLQIGAIFGP